MGRSEERDVRDELERLWLIVEQLPDGVLLTTPDGVIARVSGGTGDVLGESADELGGRRILELVVAEERERLSAGLREAGETGSFQGTFSAVGGGRRGRWLELHLLLLDGRGFVVVARDVTRPQLRERNLRVLVDGMQILAGARSISEVREGLWASISRLLPEATYLWLYAGEGDRVRMVWSSREDAPAWSFDVRGWGSRISGLLVESESGQEFLRWFGDSEAEAREKLERMISGRGGPLLLDHPEEQLRIYLGERELAAILELWGNEPPGQLIHCPIIFGGELEFLAVIDSAPGEKPFTEEDADWAWQLVSMAHQVVRRIEAVDGAEAQLAEIRVVRDAVRHVAGTTGVTELIADLCGAAVRALGADRFAVFERSPTEVDRILWSHGFPEGPESVDRRPVPELPVDGSARPEPVYLADASRDEAWRRLGGPSTVSVVAIPLVALGERVGSMAIFWDQKRDLGDGVRTLTGFFAGQLSLVLAYRALVQLSTGHRVLTDELMAAIEEGVILTDIGGRIEGVGEGVEDLLGLRNQWEPGASILDLPWGEAKGVIAVLMEQSMEGRFSTREVTLAGDRRVVATTRRAGRERLLWVFRDADEAASDQTPGGLAMFPIGVVEVDGSGRVMDMNAAAGDALEPGDAEAALAELDPSDLAAVGRGGALDVHLRCGLDAKLIRSGADADRYLLVLHPESSLEEVRRLHGLLTRVEPAMARLNDRATALIAQLAVCREQLADPELTSRLAGVEELADEIRQQVQEMADTADRALRGEWGD